jgi:hypothetical protein
MRSFDCDIVEESGDYPKVVLSAEITLLRMGSVCFAGLGALKARILDAVAEAMVLETPDAARKEGGGGEA